MVRMQLSNTDTNNKLKPRVLANRYAKQTGILTAGFMVVYNLLIYAAGNSGFEMSHILIFLILFAMIGYSMNQASKWIRKDQAMEDRMLFGVTMSVFTAIGLLGFNSILALLNFHFVVSDIFLPINDFWRFAVNSMALFWSCLIFGFLSTIIFSHFYEE